MMVTEKICLVGLAELVKLFGVKPQTVYAWRTRHVLPDPLTTVSSSPLWDLDAIEAWSRQSGRKVDGRVLRRLRRTHTFAPAA